MAFFRGGPCDGRPHLPPDGPSVVCGGVTYALGADGDYHVDTASGSAVGTAALGTHGAKAWHDLQKSVNRHLPTALVRSQKIRRATLRTISRRRRVG